MTTVKTTQAYKTLLSCQSRL